MKAVEIGGIAKFDPNGDINNVGFRWNKRFRGFRLYSHRKDVNDPEQLKALFHDRSSKHSLYTRRT